MKEDEACRSSEVKVKEDERSTEGKQHETTIQVTCLPEKTRFLLPGQNGI